MSCVCSLLVWYVDTSSIIMISHWWWHKLTTLEIVLQYEDVSPTKMRYRKYFCSINCGTKNTKGRIQGKVKSSCICRMVGTIIHTITRQIVHVRLFPVHLPPLLSRSRLTLFLIVYGQLWNTWPYMQYLLTLPSLLSYAIFSGFYTYLRIGLGPSTNGYRNEAL